MKHIISFLSVVALLALLAVPAVHAQASDQVVPGTQIRLILLNGLSTTVARSGDPFTATVAEPVFVGNQIVLPAGAKIHGEVSGVTRPKMFSMFRGGSSINIVFKSVEVESRIFPVQMSILTLYNGAAESGKQRKDLKTVEGVVVEEKHSVKNDVMDVGMGTAGGATVGMIFSHVLRGTVIGLVGSSAYIIAKKGKDVELPAQTGMLVRMDSTLSLPNSLMHNASYVTDNR